MSIASPKLSMIVAVAVAWSAALACTTVLGDFDIGAGDGGRAPASEAPDTSAPDVVSPIDVANGVVGDDGAPQAPRDSGYTATDGGSVTDSPSACTATDPTDPHANIDCMGARASGQCAANTVCFQYTDGGTYDCKPGASCTRCYETFTCGCLSASGLIPSGCHCVAASAAVGVPVVDCP